MVRPLEPRIYHLALSAEWHAAGGYETSTRGVSLADQGYTHCSFADQVQRIADLFYTDRDDVILLTIDPALLSAPVRVEQVGDAAFPHVYGPIDRAAVVRAEPVSRGTDGRLAAERLAIP